MITQRNTSSLEDMRRLMEGTDIANPDTSLAERRRHGMFYNAQRGPLMATRRGERPRYLNDPVRQQQQAPMDPNLRMPFAHDGGPGRTYWRALEGAFGPGPGTPGGRGGQAGFSRAGRFGNYRDGSMMQRLQAANPRDYRRPVDGMSYNAFGGAF